MGSQRSAAIALGLGEGDRLLIEFLEDRVRFQGVSLASIEKTTGLARLALETGAPPNSSDPLEWTCRAMGVQADDADPLATLRRRLTARKEADLAALVPDAELADADETVLDLLASLGE